MGACSLLLRPLTFLPTDHFPTEWSPQMNIASAPLTPASSSQAWPSAGWHDWTPTADRFLKDRPGGVMSAVQFVPNKEAIGQADFSFGGNFGAHGVFDLFKGIEEGRHSSREGAMAFAQALNGVQGILGVFKEDDSFVTRQVVVSDANRIPMVEKQDAAAPAREMPETLVKLRAVGEPNGSWGHGDFRTLSGLKFNDDSLLAFVGEDFQIAQ